MALPRRDFAPPTPMPSRYAGGFRAAGFGLLVASLVGLLAATRAWGAPQAGATIIVYLIDHQLLPGGELDTIRAEVDAIFASARLDVQWITEDSPRRPLEPHELRLVVLPSDGSRWFHGPSNVIGIAPHDAAGIGRNCFVFYRQAVWFRQQAVSRCREALQARTEAELRGVEVDPFIDTIAPPDCGDRLPALTAMIVARAAAHEMVHILLNKLDHSNEGLMRSEFVIGDWFAVDESRFRLGTPDIEALHQLLGTPSGGH